MRGRKTQVERQRIAVGYCRVSTREQATEGHSLAAQESRLQALAQAQGVTIDRMFVDAGCSGKNLKRQAVAELLAAIAAGSISALYICKLDRLCRNLEDLLAIVRLCGKHDVALVSASESIDTGSPAGKMMLSMLGAFAELKGRKSLPESLTFPTTSARSARYTAAGRLSATRARVRALSRTQRSNRRLRLCAGCMPKAPLTGKSQAGQPRTAFAQRVAHGTPLAFATFYSPR